MRGMPHFVAALITACTPTVEHHVTAPQLNTLVETVARACQPLPQVNPIPNQLRLIVDRTRPEGHQVDGSDAAGKRLLVDYAACYSASAGAQ